MSAQGDWQPEQSEGVRPSTSSVPYTPTNGVVQVNYRRGWIGLFSGENQTKALTRCVTEINAGGRVVSAAAPDQWGFFARLLWALVAIVTLGFVVKGPNLLLITAPAS